jgi:hypothetical protein
MEYKLVAKVQVKITEMLVQNTLQQGVRINIQGIFPSQQVK